METDKIVENFGKNLIQKVWDNIIVQMDMIFNGKMIVDIKELSDGLDGELYGETGWIKKFSEKEI